MDSITIRLKIYELSDTIRGSFVFERVLPIEAHLIPLLGNSIKTIEFKITKDITVNHLLHNGQPSVQLTSVQLNGAFSPISKIVVAVGYRGWIPSEQLDEAGWYEILELNTPRGVYYDNAEKMLKGLDK